MTTNRRELLRMLFSAGALAAAAPLLPSVAELAEAAEPEGVGFPHQTPPSQIYNVVINGPLAVVFKGGSVQVFAPNPTPEAAKSLHNHLYLLDCVTWQQTDLLLKGPVGSKVNKTLKQYGFTDANSVIINAGRNKPTGSKPFASITLPLPDNISRVRNVNVTINKDGTPTALAAAPGALVFEYSAIEGTPSITPDVGWKYDPTRKWIVDIHATPQLGLDDSLEHAQGAWNNLMEYYSGLKNKWILANTGDPASVAPASPNGITAMDLVAFEKGVCDVSGLPNDKGGGFNCKLGITLVSGG